VIAAAIGAGATVCVSCIPVLVRLYRTAKNRQSRPDKAAVWDDLERVHRPFVEAQLDDACIQQLMQDVLQTYTHHLLEMIFAKQVKPKKPKAATGDARVCVRASSASSPHRVLHTISPMRVSQAMSPMRTSHTTLDASASDEGDCAHPRCVHSDATNGFQSLQPKAGNELTTQILRRIGQHYTDYHRTIATYRGLGAQVRFLTDTYAYFVVGMLILTAVAPTDLVVYNSVTNEPMRNVHVKYAYQQRMGLDVEYLVVRKNKQRSTSACIVHSPTYLRRFASMELLLDAMVPANDLAQAKKVWWEWLHDDLRHSFAIESFMGRYHQLSAIEACATHDLVTIVAVPMDSPASTLALVKCIHTAVYSFIACVRMGEAPQICDIIGDDAQPSVTAQAQASQIGRMLVHCLDDETNQLVGSEAELQCTAGTWNGAPCVFATSYTPGRCVLFCQLV